MTADILFNEAQQELVHLLQSYLLKLQQNFIKKTINKYFYKDNKQGIYIYGDVGCGKTMLTTQFYQSINIPKNMWHFQSFMQNIHEKLHRLRQQLGFKANLIELIAKDISQEFKIVIFDEFEIRDIADAMTIARLIPALQYYGVFIVITTNIIPINLYKDGMQRNSFLPFINYIDDNFIVFQLKGQDYRQSKSISLETRMLAPLSIATAELMQKYINFFVNDNLVTTELKIFGRSIIFKTACDKTLVTDFNELFKQDFSQIDYITICNYFAVIIIDGVVKIEQQDKNLFIRLINFIDQSYYHKVIVIMRCSEPIINILNLSNMTEVARAVSRLNEMNSIEFWQQAKFQHLKK